MSRLFHVSESAHPGAFEPRARGDGPAVVWAIDEVRLPNYLLPRDCPRVTFHADGEATREDRRRLLGSGTHVVAIEEGWHERAQTTPLYLHAFDPAPFRVEDARAGYFVARTAVTPSSVTRLEHPLRTLRERGVELRVLPCLWALREEVASSTLAFSIIRFAHAAPAPAGFESRYPVPPARPASGRRNQA